LPVVSFAAAHGVRGGVLIAHRRNLRLQLTIMHYKDTIFIELMTFMLGPKNTVKVWYYLKILDLFEFFGLIQSN